MLSLLLNFNLLNTKNSNKTSKELLKPIAASMLVAWCTLAWWKHKILSISILICF